MFFMFYIVIDSIYYILYNIVKLNIYMILICKLNSSPYTKFRDTRFRKIQEKGGMYHGISVKPGAFRGAGTGCD